MDDGDDRSGDSVATNSSCIPSPPPPPPPLPPPPPPPPPIDLLRSNRAVEPSSETREDESLALEKAIKLVADVEKHIRATPFYAVYTHLQSQLQEGPKCGLVALSIATSVTGNFKSVDELLSEARRKGYTNQGEMFSCKNFAQLIQSATSFKPIVVENLIRHIDCVVQCLQNGGLMLIPYDSDRNFSPCRKRGHKAHWAVVSGLVVFDTSEEKAREEEEEEEGEGRLMITSRFAHPCSCRKASGAVRIVRDANGVYVERGGGGGGTRGDGTRRGEIYVAGKQGHSKRLALWPLESLVDSNDNLVELSREHEPLRFVLPRGGLSEGLRGKAVLLDREK